MVKRKLIVDAGGKQRIVEDCCPSGFIFTGYECVPITNTEKPTTYMSDGPVDCPDGYINLTGPHYGSFDYCLTDLNVIEDFINANPGSHPDPPYYHDERLTFGSHQEWHESTGRLKSLHYTGGKNQLTTIPNSVGNLHELEHLGLCANGITSIPTGVCNLTNLKDLLLPNNNIQGSIPECIFNIPNLRDLRLGNNELTGPIPDSIGNAVNLQYISLYGNQLTYVPEGICNLPIDWVNCYGQTCEGAFHWQDFPNWSGYALGGNNFCPEWPSCLVDAGMYSDDGFIRNSDGYQSNYYNEQWIVPNVLLSWGMNYCEDFETTCQGELLPHPHKPEKVRCSEDINFLQDLINANPGLAAIENDPWRLEDLPNNTLAVVWDNQTHKLSSLVFITPNYIIETLPNSIGGALGLYTLGMSDNLLTELPPEIGNLTNLQKLNLRNNQLTGEILSEFCNFPLLNELRLSYNNIQGSIPECLGDLPLTVLHLSNEAYPGLTGTIPQSICNNEDIHINIYGNNLCKPFPSCINLDNQNLSEQYWNMENQCTQGTCKITGDYCNYEFGSCPPILSESEACPETPSCRALDDINSTECIVAGSDSWNYPLGPCHWCPDNIDSGGATVDGTCLNAEEVCEDTGGGGEGWAIELDVQLEHGGNNLVSFPLQVENNSLNNIFGTEGPVYKITSESPWAATLVNGQWVGSGTASGIDPYKAYWVTIPEGGSSQAHTISIVGSSIEGDTYELHPEVPNSSQGINFISYDGLEPVQAGCLLQGVNQLDFLIGDGSAIIWCDPEGIPNSEGGLFYCPEGVEWLGNTNSLIKPGTGYIVKHRHQTSNLFQWPQVSNADCAGTYSDVNWTLPENHHNMNLMAIKDYLLSQVPSTLPQRRTPRRRR